jgi:thioredoxin reductase (NADPH)
VKKMYDVLIAGGGPAGLTAGIYAARGGLSVLIIERAFAGGQMALSYIIENYPGFDEDTEGAAIAHRMRKQAERMGAAFTTETIKSFELSGEVKKIVTSKNTYEAKTVILAMGALPKHVGIPGENNFAGAGVSYCATCDGAFFKNADVAVIGGGNTAVEDALYLSQFARKVYLVHRRDQFRAQKALVENARKVENIEFVLSYIPLRIEGEFSAKQLVVEHTQTKETKVLDVTGVFVAIGQIPRTELVDGAVGLTADKYIDADETCTTNIPGVFCAGDIRKKELRQIVTAVSDGAVAASKAELYILSEK